MGPERNFPWDGQVEGVPGRPVPKERSEVDIRVAECWDELSRLRFDAETGTEDKEAAAES